MTHLRTKIKKTIVRVHKSKWKAQARPPIVLHDNEHIVYMCTCVFAIDNRVTIKNETIFLNTNPLFIDRKVENPWISSTGHESSDE